MRYKIKSRATAGAIALIVTLAMPAMAWALGLGEIQTDTRIGQPFTARIPIVGVSSSDLQGLKVGLASDQAYKDAGLSEPDYLFSLKFEIEQGPQGPYVQVTSSKPVKLPFLHLLLQANWTSGEVTRQYTVLLNPPTFVAGNNAQQPVSAPTTPAPAQPARQPAEQPQAAPRPARPEQPRQPQSQQPASTIVTSMPSSYRVHHGDTLWGLARQLRSGTGVTTNQMMIALYRANPGAFHGNINRLKSGYVLRVPSRSEVIQVTAGEATRIVARQDSEWRSSQTTRVATSQGKAGTGGGESTSAGQEQPAPPETGGRVVLTTPEVTSAGSMAAASGSAVAGTVANAAGAAMASQSSSNAAANMATSTEAAVGSGASAGGPVKVHNNAMAGLAAAGSKAGPSTAATASQSKTPVSRPKTPAVNSTNSVQTGGTQTGGLMYWLQQPTGWIVIIAIILLLIAVLLFIHRRRAAAKATAAGGKHPGSQEGGAEEGVNSAEAPVIEAETSQAVAPEEAAGAEPEEGDEDLGIATYIGGPSLDVNKVDAMDEADLHIGFGDYGKAAQVLRDAIAREPSRHELRRKLLDVLFAAGDGEGFAAEAATYREQTGDAVDWEEIAVMGRQLRPHDGLFAEAAAPEPVAKQSNQVPEDELIDLDLDRLSTGTEKEPDQSEFERTMDELSTFIETYVPAEAGTPVALQLPPEESGEKAGKSAGKGAPEAVEQASEPEDGLDFQLDDDDLAPLEPPMGGDSNSPAGEPGLDVEGGGGAGSEEDMVDTKLDLARAYIDMGDGDSARGVLEEVIDEGDAAQSGEARRLLDSLD